ncbi:MAG: hypothetical protein KC931_26150, partial [Candidatus Omnitrophica bacterium]|nr:hypothetical protein [Candidatus Omnitrophota bacterium]
MQTFLQSFLKEGGFSLAQYAHFFSLRSDADFQDFLETWSWWEGSRVLSPGLQAMYGSLLVSILSVLLAGMLGIPIAFFFERNEFPGRSLFAALMLLPLTLPPVVGVVSFDLL